MVFWYYEREIWMVSNELCPRQQTTGGCCRGVAASINEHRAATQTENDGVDWADHTSIDRGGRPRSSSEKGTSKTVRIPLRCTVGDVVRKYLGEARQQPNAESHRAIYR